MTLQDLGVWREEYVDSQFTRKKEGVVLPDSTYENIKRIYPEKPWSEWGGVRLSQCKTFFVLPSGKPLLGSTVRRVLGAYDTPTRLLYAYLTIPNGQVKNFFNAVSICSQVPRGPSIRVIVVGSKAMEGGGIWHKYLAIWLASRFGHVVIDFFDPAEVEDEWSYEIEGSLISCQWYAQKVDLSLYKNGDYDVLVDDVWTYEEGPGLHARTVIKYTSFKTMQEDQVPFLHGRETRKFSHGSKEQFAVCECMVCQVAGRSASSYEDYLFLRAMAARLGHVPSCLGVSFCPELNSIDDLRRSLLTKAYTDVKSLRAMRILTSISEEMGLNSVGDRVYRTSSPQFQVFSRKRREIKEVEKEVYPWLEGKRVMFCGVSPEILGATKFKAAYASASAGSIDCDVTFVNSVEVWAQRSSSEVVYSVVSEVVAAQEFPDWVSTSRKVKNFSEFVRRKDSSKREFQEVLPYAKVGKYVDKPFSLFPYASCKVENYLKKMSKGNVLSPQVVGGEMMLGPFDPWKWRLAIVCDEKNWSLLRKNLQLYPKCENSLSAEGFLPWDITEEEFSEVDSSSQRQLRQLYYQQEVISRNIYIGELPGKVVNVFAAVKDQEEFILVHGKKCSCGDRGIDARYCLEVVLSRHERSHPMGTFPYVKGRKKEYENLCQRGSRGFYDYLESRKGLSDIFL